MISHEQNTKNNTFEMSISLGKSNDYIIMNIHFHNDYCLRVI